MSTTTEQSVDHTAGMTFDVDDKFTTPCACGRAFTSTTPSRAQQRQRSHAEQEAKKSGQPVAKVPAQPRVKTCGCGCGEQLAPKAGGLFKSGHDARFKAALARAKTNGVKVRHPQTGVEQDPMAIAAWLDERRGGGTFWQDKVGAGLADKPEPKPRPVRKANDAVAENVGAARAERVMSMLNNRRAVAQDIGTATLRSGSKYGAKVIRRQNEDALLIEFLDGPSRGQQVIIADHRFAKTKKR